MTIKTIYVCEGHGVFRFLTMLVPLRTCEIVFSDIDIEIYA